MLNLSIEVLLFQNNNVHLHHGNEAITKISQNEKLLYHRD